MAPPTRAQSAEIKMVMDSLDEREKTLVKVQTAVLRDMFNAEFQSLKDTLEAKERKIKQLSEKCESLEKKVISLETQVEELSQYGRRECIVFSGPDLPAESPTEDTTNIICDMVKSQLKLNIQKSDISVSHRLGRSRTSSASAASAASSNGENLRSRPIIVKLVNRSLKYDLISACVKNPQKCFINESLTPQRLALFRQVLWVRKVHKKEFKSCYTSEGRIIVRLKNSNQKYVITDKFSLMSFLDNYPLMKDTYTEQQGGNTSS